MSDGASASQTGLVGLRPEPASGLGHPATIPSAALRVLSLFAGIGGFDLGLERTGGFETTAFCEIDPFCRRVLAKHWPEVPCYHDVRELTAERLAADGIAVDVICGGFPCQDISLAGAGAGLGGERSGLWRDYARLVGELRPVYVIVENVSALLGRGLGDVLGDLAALGYDAEWHCIPASAIGAAHRRDRVWIVAYPDGSERGAIGGALRFLDGQNGLPQGQEGSGGLSSGGAALADPELPEGARQREYGREILPDEEAIRLGGRRQPVADAAGERCGEAGKLRRNQPAEWFASSGETIPDPDRPRLSFAWSQSHGPDWQQGRGMLATSCWWAVEPAVGRVAHGVPDRVGQLRAYGNAVVPQIPELIGRAILASGIAARSDETPQAAQPEARARAEGDAP